MSKNIINVFKIIITILFVYVVNKSLVGKSVDFTTIFSFRFLGVALILSLIIHLLQAYRWHLFLKTFGHSISLVDSIRSYFEGTLYALITPARSGELLRGSSLSMGLIKDSSLIVLVERVWTAMVIFIMAGMIWFYLPGDRGGELYSKGVTIAMTLSLIFLPIIPSLLKIRLGNKSMVRRRMIYTFLISVISQFVLICQFALLLSPINLPFVTRFLISGSTMAGMQFMPITIANMGVREFNLTHFSSLFVINNDELRSTVIITSLTILVANLVFPAFIGIVSLLLEKFNIKVEEKKI